MPELPEVEAARKLAEHHLAGKTIRSVYAADDRIVFDGVTPRTFARRLRGRTVEAVCRKGKQMWMQLDQAPHPLFHFGMTGSFHVYREAAQRPRFCKVELGMDDGTRLAMRNVRRLGRLRLRTDPLHELPISRLGFDPLTDLPGLPAFRHGVQRRTCPVKALLLDQSFAAGVGNWIADEVLFQAGIDPRRRCSSLTDSEVKQLRAKLSRVIRHAVRVDADAKRFPAEWLFHVRWGKNAAARTVDGEAIQFDTVGGRTTAWVPGRQR